jgi:hypothetical protein
MFTKGNKMKKIRTRDGLCKLQAQKPNVVTQVLSKVVTVFRNSLKNKKTQ